MTRADNETQTLLDKYKNGNCLCAHDSMLVARSVHPQLLSAYVSLIAVASQLNTSHQAIHTLRVAEVAASSRRLHNLSQLNLKHIIGANSFDELHVLETKSMEEVKVMLVEGLHVLSVQAHGKAEVLPQEKIQDEVELRLANLNMNVFQHNITILQIQQNNGTVAIRNTSTSSTTTRTTTTLTASSSTTTTATIEAHAGL